MFAPVTSDLQSISIQRGHVVHVHASKVMHLVNGWGRLLACRGSPLGPVQTLHCRAKSMSGVNVDGQLDM